jgi:hypothetical protein
MMRRQPRVDFAMYAQAVPLLLRHPSIFVMPLLAAVVDLLIGQITPFFTNAVGGAGNWLFQIVVQLVYGFCFGVAVIGANNVWRTRRATFDEAWEEGRHKAGGILIAAIGFYFLVYVAQYAGSLLGVIAQIVLQLVVAFFLIYTIPAAAIGGMPGNLAIGASFRAVRENLLGAAILAIAFVLLWVLLPEFVVNRFALGLGVIGYQLTFAAIRAIVLAYLAFPFAKQYDDVAFRGFW